MSGNEIVSRHLTGHDQTGSIEAYQSGCCRFHVLWRLGVRLNPDFQAKAYEKAG
jgi:hypothetical protein